MSITDHARLIALQSVPPAKKVCERAVTVVAIWALCGLGACGRSKPPAAARHEPTAAPSAAQLPAGISDIRFGQVVRGRSAAAGQTCSIPQPLPVSAVFAAGVRELAFTARLDPEIAKDADVSLTGPGLPEVRGTGCNAYAVSGGRLQQTQMGSSFVRSDGAAWPAGEYTLSVRVNGASATVSFRVE